MTDRERHQLIEKRQRGTLTEAEYRQYMDLLENDPTFYDELNMHSLLNETIRENNDQQLRKAVDTALANYRQQSRPTPVLAFVQRNVPYLAAAAVLIIVSVAVWLGVRSRQTPTGPQLVKLENRDVFAAETPADSNKAYFGGSSPIGVVPVRWVENSDQVSAVQYIYCRDTLTFFVKTRHDTTFLNNQRLIFDSKNRVLLLSRPGSRLLIVDACNTKPTPFPSQ